MADLDSPPACDQGDAFEAQVRADDPDRWLATRLIGDTAARREISALYAFYGEVRSVSRRARQPLAGELRLAWWSEAVERAVRGAVADHPVLAALAPALNEGRLPLGAIERIIEARRRTPDLASAADDAERVALFEGAAGALMAAAAAMLDPNAAAAATLRQGGRAWGWSGLAGALGVDEDLRRHARESGRVALRLARDEVKALPVASFPAVAYLVFTSDRSAGRPRGGIDRRARLLWAAARGRV